MICTWMSTGGQLSFILCVVCAVVVVVEVVAVAVAGSAFSVQCSVSGVAKCVAVIVIAGGCCCNNEQSKTTTAATTTTADGSCELSLVRMISLKCAGGNPSPTALVRSTLLADSSEILLRAPFVAFVCSHDATSSKAKLIFRTNERTNESSGSRSGQTSKPNYLASSGSLVVR